MAHPTRAAGTSMSLGRRLLLALAVWAGATVLFTAMAYVSYLGHGKPLGYMASSNAIRCAVWVLSVPLLAVVARRFPLHQGAWLRPALVLLLAALIVSPLMGIVQTAIMLSTYYRGHSDVPTLLVAISEGWGNFAGELPLGIGVQLALQGWRVQQEFRTERMRAAELERQLAVSRLDALRMQLQPHFLFNSLHTIAGLIGENPATARRMVVALGDLLRLTLRDAPNGLRSLAEELAFIDRYMDVMRYRLGDRLALDYQLEPDATRAEVPALLLQPLFENAVRHGAARVAGRCRIGFRAWRANGRVCVSLENDGPMVPLPEPRTETDMDDVTVTPGRGVGLRNTLARLRLQYADDFTFAYADRPTGGARVELSWPYRVAVIDESAEAEDGADVAEEDVEAREGELDDGDAVTRAYGAR